MRASRSEQAHDAIDFLCRLCELEDRMNVKCARLMENTAKEIEARVV